MPAFIVQVKVLVFKPCARLTNKETLWLEIYILLAGDWLGPIGLIICSSATGKNQQGRRGPGTPWEPAPLTTSYNYS